MSATSDNHCRLRLVPILAVLVLGALLFCSQAAAVADMHIDCEHDVCSLCSVPTSEDSAVQENPLPVARDYAQNVPPAALNRIYPEHQGATECIRGPPRI